MEDFSPDPRSPWSGLRRLVPFARPHLGRLVRAVAAMAVLALATGAYAWLVGPALRFLLTGGTEGLGRVQKLVPALATADRGRLLWAFPALLLLLAVVKGLAYLGQFYWVGQFGQRTVAGLRRSLFERLASLSPSQLAERLSGDLLSRFSADVGAVETAAIYTVASYVRDGLSILVLAAVAFSLDWRLSLAALVVVPLAAGPVSRLTRSVLSRTREGQRRLGGLAGQLQEALTGIRTLQAYGAAGAERARFETQAQAHARALSRAAWARSGVPAVTEVLAAAAIAGALTFTAAVPGLAPENLVSLLAALVLLYQPAKDLGRTTQFALQAGVASERLLEILDAVHPVADAPDARVAPAPEREVIFEDVRFGYGRRGVLSGLSLRLPVGQVTALVGPSGSGKSTAAGLLLRFVRPDRGRLLWDGVDVDAYSAESLRSHCALVTQEPLLFSGSVLDNLLLARPEATPAEVEAAARVAQADGFIRALPEGYDTELGEGGVRLSGGEKQRLCLARAVLRGARILVLDEATSSLDPQGEREVQTALAGVLSGRTALLIAHRLDTVVDADVVHVLESGAIVESGSHADLLARGGAYARAWALQHAAAPGASAA